MKTFVVFGAISVFLVALTFTVAKANCVSCGKGDSECQRVIVGNEVHIFYGKREACEAQQ